ncbi:MAG: hypothetical protein ACKPKO_30010, partial [Candidatus Fonsibacter sp.]
MDDVAADTVLLVPDPLSVQGDADLQGGATKTASVATSSCVGVVGLGDGPTCSLDTRSSSGTPPLGYSAKQSDGCLLKPGTGVVDTGSISAPVA